MHISLCLSDNIIIIIAITITTIITYHVPSQCAMSILSNSSPDKLYRSF